MERLHAIVSGKVQMVFYRDFTQKEAKKLNLKGMVRNLPDSTVEIIAEGVQKDLEALLERLKCGPYHAEVSNVEEKWTPATNEYDDFTIESTPDVLG